MNKLYQALITLLLCGILNQAYAFRLYSHFTESQHQLSSVKKNIQALKTDITTSKNQRGKLEKTLKASETHISQAETNLVKTRLKIKVKLKKLTATQSKRDKLRHELSLQRSLLSQHIIAAYMLGREAMVKLVLNQQRPEIIDRNIIYYQYLARARQKTIATINKTAEKLHTVASKISHQELALEKIQHQQLSVKKKLNKAQHKRKHTLSLLSKQISSKQQQLKKLENDKNRLQRLVKLLNERSYYFTPGKNFASNKGFLPWPVKHFSIEQKYNTLIAGGRMHATGMTLSANAGTPIHAIDDGKVVFADWLRGFGFLTIVQHGKHYMTLYARCQSLFVKKDEHVKPGQIIASVGDSGGYQHPALYFEIRHYGKPQNPLYWLRKH